MNRQMLGQFTGVLMLALEPIVFRVGGVYAGMVYGAFVHRPVMAVARARVNAGMR